MKINDKEHPVGIIGAMDEEVCMFRSLMSSPTETVIGRHTFLCGSICGVPVVISRAGVGKVNAAICATLMAERFSPSFIINTGVAGALADDLVPGDAVIGVSAVEYDLDYGGLGDPRGAVFYPDGTSETLMPTDPDLADALLRAASACGLHSRLGAVASGDRFVNDPAVKKMILDAFPDSAVCEMEGAAIVHACRMRNIRCGVLRTVSDKADGSADVDFPSFMKASSENAARVICRFLDDNR